MGEFLSELPDAVQRHIKGITLSSGLPEVEESYELMAEAWLAKKEAFERETSARFMEESESLEKGDERGALVLTYSGSLLNIGGMDAGVRFAEYTSIGLRSDVPDSAENGASVLSDDVEIGGEVLFSEGPVTKTSAVYKIAICSDDLSHEEQDEALSNATMVLSNEFADINKTLILD